MTENNKLFTAHNKEILQKARDTYGAHKQIGVAAEECTELAKELIKAFRYDNFEDAVSHTRDCVIDEVADVLIVLDHVIALYNIKVSDIKPQILRKIERLEYWLQQSDSIEFTTKVRSVERPAQKPYDVCDYCDYKTELKEAFSEKICNNCMVTSMRQNDEISRL